MRKMKDSGIECIGQIPQTWDICKIKNCFNVFAGATPKSGNSEFWDGDIVWVTPADYTTEQKYINEGRKSITQEGFASCSTEMIPAGSLIFSKRAPIGLVAINTVDLCTNQGCLSCVPFNENDVEYFYYAFSCFTEQFDLYGSGTTFKEISADAFVNFPIPCPAPEIQRKISEYLRCRCAEIDALIAAKEKTNALLKERRQSIIYEAVTKGLNLDAPMKDSGVEWIGQIPKSSDIIRFKYLCDVSGRIGFRGYTQADIVPEGEGPITLSPSNIEELCMNYTKCTHLSWDKYYESPEIQVAIGDVLLVKTGSSYGKSAIVESLPMEATINPQLAVIKNIRCNARYLYYCMQTDCFKYQVEQAVVGGTIPTMAQEKINNFIVVLPDDDSCENIVAYLDRECFQIQSMISANEEIIKKLKEYRQSIIYEAVTGKIEI